MENKVMLSELLQNDSITADIFFQTPGIATQIKSQLQLFVRYTRSHRPFAVRMIQLALDISYEELNNEQVRIASHAINEVLGNEEPAIAELFFENTQTIGEELEGSIQTEAQRLFECEVPDRLVEVEKYELAKLSLNMLGRQVKNETCLGHIHKVFAFLIRHNSNDVLQFLEDNPIYLQQFLANTPNYSISNLIAQLLACEDKTKVYKFEALKQKIVRRTIDNLVASVCDDDRFDGLLVLVEQILNSTKQSHFQFFQDFQKVANLLVSAETVKKFYDILLAHEELSFGNASRFLEIIINRINSEKEDSNYFDQATPEQSPMKFETSILFQSIDPLIAMLESAREYSNATKIAFVCFLNGLFINTRFTEFGFNFNQSLSTLFKAFNYQKKAGIYKVKLHQLISTIISSTEKEKIIEFVDSNEQIFTAYFTSLRSANTGSTKTYNKNNSSGFDISILGKLQAKDERVFQKAQKGTGKDLKRMHKKFQTKIASFCQTFKWEDSENFFQFSTEERPVEETKESSASSPFALNIVGKNINIPTLSIPGKPAAVERVLEDVEQIIIRGGEVEQKVVVWDEKRLQYFVRHMPIIV